MIEGVVPPGYDKEDIQYNYAYFPVLFREEVLGKGIRNRIYEDLKNNNIYARKYFYPLTPCADCYKGMFETEHLNNATYVADNILTLPLYPEIKFEVIDEICEIVKGCVI